MESLNASPPTGKNNSADTVPISPMALLDDLRMEVSEAFYYDGPEAALAAVANASMMLAPLIATGELSATLVGDMLQEVSENLTLIHIFGMEPFRKLWAFGPRIYSAYKRRAA